MTDHEDPVEIILNNYNDIYDENQMVYYKYCCCDNLFDFSCCFYYE